MSGLEGHGLRTVALDYLKIRKACMQPVFKPRREREAQVVAPSLDKDKPEILPVPQEECLQNDLEERARKQTIDDLA